jgi:hypothetical protein
MAHLEKRLKSRSSNSNRLAAVSKWKTALPEDQSVQNLGANCVNAIKSLGVEGIYFDALRVPHPSPKEILGFESVECYRLSPPPSSCDIVSDGAHNNRPKAQQHR